MKAKNNLDRPKGLLKLKSGLQMRQFGLDFGIYDHESKSIYMLNPTAGLIFNYLPTGKSHDEIVQNIEIAFGESSEETKNVKKDLEAVLEEFVRLNLVEQISGNGAEVENSFIISENEMTSLPMSYLPPTVKAYKIADLRNKYKRQDATIAFSDTYVPSRDPVKKPASPEPVKKPAPGPDTPRFSDTWKPDKAEPDMTRFSDTWKPDTAKPKQTRFSETTIPGQNL